MATNDIKQRMKSLEKRIAKLEKAAVLFEVHRQSWLNLNKELKKMHQEMERDRRKRLERESRIKAHGPAGASLFTQIHDLKRGIRTT